MGKKILIFLLVVVLIAVGAFGGIYINDNFFPSEEVIVIPTPEVTPESILSEVIQEKQTVSMDEVRKILEPASELITAKYYYTEASTYENYKEFKKIFEKHKIPFTTDKTVFTYDGVISVGIDLSKVEISIDENKNTIHVILPPLEKKHNEIDHNSFQVPYSSDSPFTKTDMKDYTDLLDTLSNEKAEEVMNNTEFINFAKSSTETVLEAFLKTSSLTNEYELEFSWK